MSPSKPTLKNCPEKNMGQRCVLKHGHAGKHQANRRAESPDLGLWLEAVKKIHQEVLNVRRAGDGLGKVVEDLRALLSSPAAVKASERDRLRDAVIEAARSVNFSAPLPAHVVGAAMSKLFDALAALDAEAR